MAAVHAGRAGFDEAAAEEAAGTQARAQRLVLQAQGIDKRVGSGRAARQLLRGLDLEVQQGEMVAVLGRSGSGKSTLLHVLGGLDRPDAGRIRLAGQTLTGASERELSHIRLRRLGFVFQSFQLIDELTGEQNVMLAASLPGAPPGARERAAALIERLGVAPVARRAPHELSGGEQQRFAIARALVNDPALVLADEATGSLDASSGAAVLELLRGLTGEGRAVVLVTHEPQAAAVADRVLCLTGGRLEPPASGSGRARTPGPERAAAPGGRSRGGSP